MKSYVENRANALATVENAKKRKYKNLAKSSHSVFHALAFTAYGGWGRDALKCISDIADLVVERSFTGDITRSEFLSCARRAIAVALTRGNGNLVRMPLQLAQRRPVRSFSVGGSVAVAAAIGWWRRS